MKDFKFWGAAPGGFFENPTIFDVFGLGFPSSGVRLVRWPLPLGRWPHSGDSVSCVFFSPVKLVLKPIFEPITGLNHYSSWIRLVFLCRFMSSIRRLAL